MKVRRPRKLYAKDRRKLVKLLMDYGFAMFASGVWRCRHRNLDPHFEVFGSQKEADSKVAEAAGKIHDFLDEGTR